MDAEQPTTRMKKERLKQIGPYRVKIRLGQGGMGTVYLCEDPHLDRFVAVKVLRKDLCHEEANRARFLREARALAGLSHPNVVTIYAVEPGEEPYFAMEYVQGGSLFERLRQPGALSVKEACRIIREAIEGLKALHAGGIIHRDITPSNILIDKDGAAKIVDFGLALEREAAGEDDLLMGTPHYMAPEQVSDARIDLRADIYGLGATFYHMLAGEAPFSGTDRDKVVAVKLAGDPEPVNRKRTDVPQRLAQMVQKMLARNPGERYPSCDSLLADLNMAERASPWVKFGVAAGLVLIPLVIAGSLLLTRGRYELGSVGALRAEDGSMVLSFHQLNRQNLRLAHFIKPAESGGSVPVATPSGLHFSKQDYEVMCMPVRLRRLRLTGMKFMPSRGHLKISFGHPDFFARSFSCVLRPLEETVLCRAILRGRVEMEKVLPVGRKLRRFMGNGFDLTLTFHDDMTVAIDFFETGSAVSLLAGSGLNKLTLPALDRHESWRDGVLRFTMASFPQSYEFLLRGMIVEGQWRDDCLAHWITGDDAWRALW